MTRPPLCWLRVVLVVALATVAGCHRDMRDQPRYEPLEPSDLFANGQSARPLIAGTVARGTIDANGILQTGKVQGRFATELPMKIDRKFLHRGQERFDIFCAPCHGRTGVGDGMIVQRGFHRPPSFHSDRLREVPHGHFFDVITNGFGDMPRYAPQIPARDRWAIVAYVRALQLSQHAQIEDVPQETWQRLEKELP